MWLISAALRRPFTVLVAVLGIALGSGLAYRRMAVDIFPNLNLPVIYVAQPYGGLDPAQMEGFVTYYYEYHFLYIAGIEHIESRSIQHASLMKLFFHPGTDMSQALAQVVSYVERSRAFMPPGTVPPFVMRFDAGSVAVGQLVFSSDTRSVKEIQDLALNRVRPEFARLPGVSAPPPFGGSARTVVVRVDPERLRAYGMSADDVVKAVAAGNAIVPSGNLRAGDLNLMTPINSVVTQIRELESLPIRSGAGPSVYLRDLGKVLDSSDILTSYALANGRRAVYIPVTKRAEASTVDVVARVKAALPAFRALVPDDIQVSFEFDQSGVVLTSLRTLAFEGALGAILTGLMVFLFLRDLRSAFIVVLTIPFSVLGAVVGLWLTGQTLNIMTLGGLALAIGILVDEATVAIENIHAHLAKGKRKRQAVLDASAETLVPRFLAMLSILAVFAPSLFMEGASRSLFVPLSLAVGFAMATSYFLSNTLVPVLSAALLREGHETKAGFFQALQGSYGRLLLRLAPLRWAVLLLYLAGTGFFLATSPGRLGVDIFPASDTGQFMLRLRAPTGTRVERTEGIAQRALEAIAKEAGDGNVEVTLAFVGVQPSSFPVNLIHLWTSGSQEAVLRVALRKGAGLPLQAFQERLRACLPDVLPPGTSLSFEAGDVVGQIMNFGAPTPIEVAVGGPQLAVNQAHAEKVRAELSRLPFLRDLQVGQPLDYPTLEVQIDRERAGQLGLTAQQVGRAFVSATSSSRFTQPVYWRDPGTGIAYQVQVEIPQARMSSIADLESVPVGADGLGGPLLGEVAKLKRSTMPGEYYRYNMQRTVTLTANVVGKDLGSAAREVQEAIRRAGEPPRAVTVAIRGQVPPLEQTRSGLELGLLLAFGAIFLLLCANFQSIRLALVVLSTAPAIVAGVLAALLLTGTTLNIQSFIGAIMALGVGVANAILLVTFAEESRKGGRSGAEAAVLGASGRLRPILMTTFAMIAGMMPMALGWGEGSEQTVPLGRAVIGGLAGSTLAVLFIVPSIFMMVQGGASRRAPSLHPEDEDAAALQPRSES
jgi:multidrug efflux pump subunit AcrB